MIGKSLFFSVLLLLSVFASSAQARSPVLRWEAVRGADTYHVEISHTAHFAKIWRAVDVVDTSYELRGAKPGKYYWRVFPVDERGRFGEPRPAALLIVALKAPVPERQGEKVDVASAVKMKTQLKWKGVKRAAGYEVQISHEPAFELASSKKVKGNKLSMRFLKTGTYYWRVRALSRRGKPASRYSEAMPLEVIDSRSPLLVTAPAPQGATRALSSKAPKKKSSSRDKSKKTRKK